MNRNMWIMFGMIAIVIISLLLVALLILVPQSEPITSALTEDYEAISKSEYLYTQSKDVSEEAMKETYSITSEDINEGKSFKLYKQGNTDPFKAAEAPTNGEPNSNKPNSSSGNSTNNSTNTGTNNSDNTTTKPASAEDK